MILISFVFFWLCHFVSAKVIWDGRFNGMKSSSELSKWSWSNQVGPYQYYIHGKSPVSSYVNLDASYKNPADKTSQRGVKITLDKTAQWQAGSGMLRTELIPQTKAPINKGKVYYHFSVMRKAANAPDPSMEHQIMFFESKFTELKFGSQGGPKDGRLHWYVGGRSNWSTAFDANLWNNFAYEIDFSRKQVGLWHSTGASPLKRVKAPEPASTFSDGKDFHVGLLRLPKGGASSNAKEDWYFSGVYIESDPITTSISGPT